MVKLNRDENSDTTTAQTLNNPTTSLSSKEMHVSNVIDKKSVLSVSGDVLQPIRRPRVRVPPPGFMLGQDGNHTNGSIPLCVPVLREQNLEWPYEMNVFPVFSQISENDGANNNADDDLRFHKYKPNPNDLSLSIVSFNVLAESYLSPRSHRNLPLEYASIVFDPSKRRELLLQTLKKIINCSWSSSSRDGLDILCLQEVDMYEDLIEPFMKQLGYDGFQSKTMNAPKSGKVDSCAIFWKAKDFECIKNRVVDFDDLAKEESMTDAVEKLENNDESVYDEKSIPSLDINGNPYPTNDPTYYNRKKKKTQYRKQNIPSSLSGMAQSFARRNAACFVLLKYKRSGAQRKDNEDIFAVVSSHLYWNPGYEYVKLAQSKYLLEELHSFVKSYDTNEGLTVVNTVDQKGTNEGSKEEQDEKTNGIPIIVCGDMNSKPDSMVYRFFVDEQGVDARKIAPWYSYEFESDDDYNKEEKKNNSEYDNQNGPEKNNEQSNNDAFGMESLNINSRTKDDFSNDQASEDNTSDQKIPQIRYLLDFSLNKFTRWLRMLGIDAALETEEEEEERTRSTKPRIALFERCYREKRTLITTSYKLLKRKGCPPGAYLINPTCQNIEQTLCHLLLTHGVVLQPSQFLVRCVICNSNFREITNPDEKQRIFEQNKAPMLMDLSVWECEGCHQGYWWSEHPGSSASRVKNQVTKLFRLALRAGVEYREPLDMFDFVNIEDERKYAKAENGFDKYTASAGGKVAALEWLKEKNLSHPFDLRSMYAKIGESIDENETKEIFDGELLPFTNVTDDFVGTLDYIFFESNRWTLTNRLIVPISFNDLNKSGIEKGHLLPSAHWPSDHLAIGGTLVLKRKEVQPVQPLSNNDNVNVNVNNMGAQSSKEKKEILSFPKAPHIKDCPCGCIPQNILSIFEMAALRKKLREERALANASK